MGSLDAAPTKIDRYAVYGEIAAGGMATVHFGRLVGPAGFGRIVAIKQLHKHLASDPEFATMLLDEARLAARLHHPNVVQTLDVVATDERVCLVMEYIRGASLATLVKRAGERGETVDPKIAVSVMAGVLHGLHAAHEAADEKGKPLGIVHRDVSPQNVLVGTDGVARLLDFGVAKAAGRVQTTREGQLKGKLAYMAPEQLQGKPVDRRTDVFAASIVLWELLTGERLFAGDNEGEVLHKVMQKEPPAPSARVKGLPVEMDELVLRGLQRDPSKRFATARAMAIAVERCAPMAMASDVGEWVSDLAGDLIAVRADQMAAIEAGRSTQAGELRSEIRTVTAPTTRRGRRTWMAIGGAVAVAAAGGVMVLIAERGALRAEGRIERKAPSASTTAIVAATETTTATTPTSAANAATSSVVAATTTATAAPSTAKSHDAEAPLMITVSASPATPPTARFSARPRVLPPSCSPPYTIDANGFKKYKVECL